MPGAAKKIIAATAAVVIMGFLVAKFVLLLEPAVTRERVAACNGLKPGAPTTELLSKAWPAFPMPAPDFAVQDINGDLRRLSEFRGEVVLLNFWADWCPPCKEELPSIVALQERMAQDDFVVLALASNAQWNSVVEEFPNGTDLTVLLDPPASEDDTLGKVARYYGTPALPESYLVDKHGYIRYYFINKRDWKSDVAITCIRSLIEEEDSLSWLKSWLLTTSQTSFGSS
jgi:thiol-disulfide isomerase/thioredoxin